MNILLTASEAVPFAKTGGLADVCGALPLALARLGHRVTVILPAHRTISYCGRPIEPLGIDFIVPIGSKTVAGHLLEGELPGADVPVYFVRQDAYYDREDLYAEKGESYTDNCERFVFFSRAVMEAVRLLGLDVDLIHANDWQTGLVPAYLATEYRNLPRYRNVRSLFTIHNLRYQGNFWHWDMLLTGLDWKYFNWRQMEAYGELNLLKTGLSFADAVSTVSPRYAQEIQTPELGECLEGALKQRSDVLSGILNGVDYDLWNPATDPVLAANYDADTVHAGKPICKTDLQNELSLPPRSDVPLVGMIGRLTEQKGFDLVAEVIPKWMETSEVQWVFLGTGEPEYHQLLGDLTGRYPQKVAARLEFSDLLAHKIEAGADVFLMPSRYEPCGLNQMYSLKYGTVPVVRETGGLADTVVNVQSETLANRTANGFSFREGSAQGLSETLQRACEAFRRPDVWSQLIDTGMRQDWSWSRSARQYGDLYERIVNRAQHAVAR
ncbi:MAG: glycogen synthase GlgA [Planctomycetota bacterium]